MLYSIHLAMRWIRTRNDSGDKYMFYIDLLMSMTAKYLVEFTI